LYNSVTLPGGGLLELVNGSTFEVELGLELVPLHAVVVTNKMTAKKLKNTLMSDRSLTDRFIIFGDRTRLIIAL
jgi:hypothetical protein